MHELDSKRV